MILILCNKNLTRILDVNIMSRMCHSNNARHYIISCFNTRLVFEKTVRRHQYCNILYGDELPTNYCMGST